MIKKLSNITNVVPLILAVSAAIAFIVACGKGNAEKIDEEMQVLMDDAQDYLQKNDTIFDKIKSSSSKEKSSSSGDEKNSSGEDDSSSSKGSSSSLSSGSGSSSSSGKAQSSSSVGSDSNYDVFCDFGTLKGTAEEEVPCEKRPKVTCVNKDDPTDEVDLDQCDDIDWIGGKEGNPNWKTPVAGTYSNIKVKVLDDAKACKNLSGTCKGTFTVCPKTGPCTAASSSSKASSSSVAASSSSVTPSSSATASSSSRASSSSVAASSSSAVQSSSSTPTLTCASVTQSITTGQTPKKPTVTCGTTEVTTGITWSPTSINSPITTAGSITNVTATATCGGSSQTANCAGTITVTAAPTLTCASITQSITTGQTPTKPPVTCGTTAVTTGITWSPTSINSPITTAGSITNVTATATCGGSSQTANCAGTITVTAASSCQYQATYCGGAAIGSVKFSGNNLSNTPAGCYFLTDFSRLSVFNNGTLTINGVAQTITDGNACASWATSCNTLMGTKADGGYYVYISSNGELAGTLGTKNPSCQ